MCDSNKDEDVIQTRKYILYSNEHSIEMIKSTKKKKILLL